jgi:predicted transcriptional regulator
MLLAFSISMILLYYKRIRNVHQEYEEAKDIVKDIIISFNNQLRQLEKRVETVAHKVELLSVKGFDITSVTEQLKRYETRLSDITSKVQNTLALKEQLLPQIKNLNQRLEKLAKAQEKMAQQISKPQEVKIEGVIPIRREKALAQLTPTELRVLEILLNEGQKTAPEIKSKIELTREHTARLMKKLYEKGYVERDETKTPYAYRIKEEMRKILKKTEFMFH